MNTLAGRESARLWTVVFAAAVALALLTGTPGSTTGPMSKVPSLVSGWDLPLAAQGAVSGRLGEDDTDLHAAQAGTGIVTLRNVAHGIDARFDEQGMSVRSGEARLDMSLDSIGRADSRSAVEVATPTAQENRVSYDRGPVDEWYINGPLGIEQGFTLDSAPGDRVDGRLALGLGLSGNVRGTLADSGDAVTFADATGRELFAYRGLIVTDATGRELPARMLLSGDTLTLSVDDAGARYPLTVDPFLQQAKLTGTGGRTESLGFEVDMNADTIVAGAPREDAVMGAVYVFTKPAGGWTDGTQVAKLTPRTVVLENGERPSLGASVAISDDGRTIVAGANGRKDGRGSVYVFERPSSGWTNMTETAVLMSSDAGFDTLLGESVDISGSGSTVVAGAVNYPENIGPGAVMIFEKPATGWADATETAKLTASDGDDKDSLGRSLAIDGDVIVAGSRHGSSTEPFEGGEGAVYVFEKPSSGWEDRTQTARLTASDADEGQALSTGVDVQGDTIVATRAFSSGGGDGTPTNPTGVYVFRRPSSGWDDAEEQAKLALPPDDSSANGIASPLTVALDGDRIVAGLPFHDDNRGVLAVYERPDSGFWTDGQEVDHLLQANDRAAGDGLGGALGTAATNAQGAGRAVAIEGDIIVGGAPGDGDGHDELGNAINIGAVYVFAERQQRPPVADAGGPYTTDEGTNVGLTAAGSSDPDGDALSYAWDLDGDGQFDDSTSKTPSFTDVSDNRTFTVEVEVTDALGAKDTATATATVTVRNVAPVLGAVTTSPATVLMDVPVTVSAPFTDAGSGDTHTCWIDPGDGDGQRLVTPVNGRCSVQATYSSPGPRTVSVTVTDDDGASDTETKVIDVKAACNGVAATVIGTEGNDRLILGPGQHVVAGLGGDDRIEGTAAGDLLCGHAGKDTILGKAGSDKIFGGLGLDKLDGGSGDDTLFGEAGADVLIGGSGRDRLDGGSESDQCSSGETLTSC